MLCLSIPTPGFPHFTNKYILGAHLGSLLHGDVSGMIWILCPKQFAHKGLFSQIMLQI